MHYALSCSQPIQLTFLWASAANPGESENIVIQIQIFISVEFSPDFAARFVDILFDSLYY